MRDCREKTLITVPVIAWLALALMPTLALPGSALAQQGSFNPPPTLPQTRSQGGGGTTLELPITRQPLSTANAPQLGAPQTGPELSIAPHELRRQPGYEQVVVTVTNQRGGYETGLQKDDLKLYVDGVQRPIDFFRRDTNTPVSVGILVDTSGSMAPKLPQARAAIAEFVNQMNPQNDIFLFAFADRPWLLQPFTTNHPLLLRQLKVLHAEGVTSLFDTIIDGLLMVRHGRWDKRALLVLTDGGDNDSQNGVPEVVAAARRMGVLVYAIGIGDPHPTSGFLGALNQDAVDAATLNTLSTETGGRTFILREVGDGEALRQACASMSQELQQQYTVGFVASDASRSGYRSLRVDVPGHPGDNVRVRKGVMVGPGTESASATAP
jgi:Ca-activated chloride channel family protein